MPLNPRPLHGADHPRPAADAPPEGFRDWSRRVGEPAPARTIAGGPARIPAPRPDLLGLDAGHPLLKLAAVAFVGYTLGRLVHRAPASVASTASAPASAAPPRPASRPVAATVRLRPPEREPRSSIRFR